MQQPLIRPDGRYNRPAILALAFRNLEAEIAMDVQISKNCKVAPAGRMFCWRMALTNAWQRAKAERTRWNIDHRQACYILPDYEARELASDGRL